MARHAKLPSREAAGHGTTTLVAGVALFSSRPAELARFYEQVLRTSFTHRVHDDGREHWIVEMSGVQVEIKALVAADGSPTADAHASDAATGMSRSELSFRIAGVASAVARSLVAGGRLLEKAQTHSWGTWAVVLDPDGNRLGLFEPALDDSNSEEEQA